MAFGTRISGKYELLECLHEGGVRTYRARHCATGREVMLHFVAAGSDESVTLLERLAQLPEDKRRLFIDAGDQDSGAYVVSWTLRDFVDLLGWLERATSREKRPSPKTPKVLKESMSAPGEFTRLFMAGMKSPSPAAGPAVGAAPARAEGGVREGSEHPVAGGDAAGNQPGDFTALFGRPAQPVSRPPLPQNPSPPAPPAEVRRTPDAPAAGAQSGIQDEFSEYFAGESPAPRPPAGLAPPTRPPKQKTGGLTDFFRSVRSPVVKATAKPVHPVTDAQGVSEPKMPGAGQPPAVPAMPGSGRARAVQPVPTPQPGPAAPPPAPKEPQRPPLPGHIPIWIGFGLLLLLGVAVVLFFALRSH